MGPVSTPQAQPGPRVELGPFTIVRGLDIPLAGEPVQSVSPGPPVRHVAVLGADYYGLRPKILVNEGNPVWLGQPLLSDKNCPEIQVTSPGSGIVTQINRGPRRTLQSIVVELFGDEQVNFERWSTEELQDLKPDEVRHQLLHSGLWTALRSRPLSTIPDPGSVPASIFVTAMDTRPLAPRPDVVIGGHAGDFSNGLAVLTRLTDGKVHVCMASGVQIPIKQTGRISAAAFAGPHPAGLAGTHMHFLGPVSVQNAAWHIGYQDVIAIGKLFTTGRLWTDRIISLAGPVVQQPRLIHSRLGVSIDDLTQNDLTSGNVRIISGSVLDGHHAHGANAFLGRFHNQISVISEGQTSDAQSPFYGFFNRPFCAYGLSFANRFTRPKEAMTTAAHGPQSAFLPLGGFERVMPLDILATPLLRALIVGDTEAAIGLGCLELDAEDLALCTYLCPGKFDYGALLRDCLDAIRKEG